MLLRSLLLAFVALLCTVLGQKMDDAKTASDVARFRDYRMAPSERLAALERNFLEGLAEMEAEGLEQPKIAEKRRNKFEFIRFGRK